jgi:hypothetical protein
VVSVRAFCCAVPTRTSAACHIKIRTWRVLTPARRPVPSADDEVDGSPGTGYPGKRAVHGITELAGLISTPASSLSSDRGATRGPGCAKGRANHRAVTIHAIRLKGGGIVCSRYDPEGPCDPDFQRGPTAFAAFLSACAARFACKWATELGETRVAWLDLQQRLVTADRVVEPGHAVAPSEVRRGAALARGRCFCLRGFGLGGLW